MDFALTPEQNLIVETVRRFVEQEIYPLEKQVEKNGRVETQVANEIKRKVLELGFYAPNFPIELGGGGLDHLSFALLERELGRGSMALTHFWGRPQNILMACKGQQRQRFLLPALRGEKMDALAMTEPGAGSDIRNMQAKAKRVTGRATGSAKGEGWLLNGTKHFISGAEHADFVITFFASGQQQTPRGIKQSLTCFIVERGTKGFSIEKGYQSVSHRGYPNSILTFDDCFLSDEYVLGEVDQAYELMSSWLYATRLTVAAQAVGRARRAFELAATWAAERKQFGKTIGSFQGVGFKIADMITKIDASDWLTLNAAWRLDQGLPAQREIASAKLFATEMLASVTDEAIQIYGGMGLMDDLPLERFWRDARVERIWDGTSEIQRHIIAREILRPLEQKK